MTPNLPAEQNDFMVQLQEAEKMNVTVRKLLETKHYQALKEEGVYAILAKAKALGIHPFEALNGGFHCINGKVGMSTEMMAALVRQKGHSITKDPKSTPECVILHGKRKDNGDQWTIIFGKEDAVAAGLWGSATWKKYPQVMLYNRAMSMLFRQLFPDISLGAGYVEDELKEITRTGEYANKIEIKSLPVADVQVKTVEIPLIPVETIGEEKAKDLAILLEACSDEYKAKVMARLEKAYGAKELSQVPTSKYEAIYASAVENQIKPISGIDNANPDEANYES